MEIMLLAERNFFFLKAMASVFFSLELKTPCVHVPQTLGRLVCCPVGRKLMVLFMTRLFKKSVKCCKLMKMFRNTVFKFLITKTLVNNLTPVN